VENTNNIITNEGARTDGQAEAINETSILTGRLELSVDELVSISISRLEELIRAKVELDAICRIAQCVASYELKNYVVMLLDIKEPGEGNEPE
jgi:hypothetical protein